MVVDSFANRLNKLMNKSSLTVREVAEAIEVSHSTLQNWRSGTIPIDYIAIKKLAKYLGVSFSFVLTGEDDQDLKGHRVLKKYL